VRDGADVAVLGRLEKLRSPTRESAAAVRTVQFTDEICAKCIARDANNGSRHANV
jgi:hypothetical protein